VQLVYDLDGLAVDALVAHLRRKLERPARPATLAFRGGQLVVVPARAGRTVDAEALAARLSVLPMSLRVPVRRLAPRVRARELLAARGRAERILRHPPVVSFGSRRAVLDSRFVREALRFRPRLGRFDVQLDPALLERRLGSVFADLARQPRNATFAVEGTRVRIVPSVTGRELDSARIAAELVAHAGQTDLMARFRRVEPRFTTAEARELRIQELVSEYTTRFPCCAPRVRNIQHAALLLDGTIAPSGAMISLNAILGPRTKKRGFVEAPMIDDGRLVQAFGGGVSQLATTLYNASFFAGLDLVRHTPHEFYISRYPMGREATLSWGSPDLVVRNDWPAAVLVKAAASPTSVTIRLYSASLGRGVETETGRPSLAVPARTRRTVNPSLQPGVERVVQEGGVSGFTVTYTRRVFRGKVLRRSERWIVRYRPEDRIVELGPPRRDSRGTAKRESRPERRGRTLR